MAINTNTPRQEFTASGGQTAFVFNFKIFATSDIVAYLTPTGQTPNDTNDLLVETTHYTIVIDGDNGGTLTLVTPATAGDSITITRDLSVTRTVEYQQGGDILASTSNQDQEYQTYLIQQNESNLSRYIKLPEASQGLSATLPNPLADAYFKWDSAGTALENDTTIPDNVLASEDSNLEAGSWANEDEDVPVKEYTSGVPSDRAPTVYSAKHWAIKAQDAVIGDTQFRDTEFRIFDDIDATKKLKFELSGVTSGTTGTITMPGYNVTIGGIKDKEVNDSAIGDDKILVYKAGPDEFVYEAKTSGKVLQYKHFKYDAAGNSSTTSATFVDTLLTTTFTPTSTSSKILVMATINGQTAGGLNNGLGIFRDSTQIGNDFNMSNADALQIPASMTVEDSPASTSSLTYKVRAKVSGGGTYNYHISGLQNTLTIIEMEG